MTAGAGGRSSDRIARVLAALAPQGHQLVRRRDGACELRTGASRVPTLVASEDLVQTMYRNDWLTRAGDAGFVATDAGLAWLRRQYGGGDPWRGQHLAKETTDVETEAGATARVEAVVNESPLTWLRRRRGPGGDPLVSDLQYRAGERLRAEFERGQLGPRVTADWTRPALARGRRGSGSGPAELLDSAVAARQRIDDALRSLGPDLGSLLIDVCCYLVGLEDAERSRGWPRRSAKVVLRIALDRLADHYGLSDTATGRHCSRRVLHWGTDDYRPKIDERPVEGDVS